MRRHEAWRAWYQSNRYLKHLDESELWQRGRELMNVNTTLTDDGFFGILEMQKFGTEAIERFTHFLEECQLRELPLDLGNDPESLKERVPDLFGSIGKRATAALRAHPKIKTALLFKFGQARFLRPLLTEGKFRIQPASAFSDPKHNQAVGDNELSRSFSLHVPRPELLALLKRQGLPQQNVDCERFEFHVEYYSDYWVTCFAKALSPRLAVDFNADAMLAVYDVPEFSNRLKKAFRRIPPYRAMQQGSVRYFDPYFPRHDIKAVPLIKPFKYYYQHEYRFFWHPKKPIEKVEFVDIDLGSLEDICELVSWEI